MEKKDIVRRKDTKNCKFGIKLNDVCVGFDLEETKCSIAIKRDWIICQEKHSEMLNTL